MTEAEWLACADPTPMLEFLKGKASDRKLRLFGCACCRRIWPLLTDTRSQRAVQVAEGFADGLETGEALGRAFLAADSCAVSVLEVAERSDSDKASYGLFHAAAGASQVAGLVSLKAAKDSWHFTVLAPAGNTPYDAAGDPIVAAESIATTAILCCIFGNPFHHVTILPVVLAWNDRTIPKLAQAIYDEGAFDRMPILADALEEAGCSIHDILNHCRQPGVHVRGCWVVDLVLGKG